MLGWLYVLAGWMGLVTGLSLVVLAAATLLVATEPVFVLLRHPAVWLLVVVAFVLMAGGLLMVVTGRAVVARRSHGRPAALVLAVAQLVLLPFGTALSVYTLWAMLNDDARRAFGRPPRAPASA